MNDTKIEHVDQELLYEYSVIDFNAEKLLLITYEKTVKSFVPHDYQISEDRHTDDSDVYITVRWLVDVLPSGPFDTTYTTHRNITYKYKRFDTFYKETLSERKTLEGTKRKIVLGSEGKGISEDKFIYNCY